MPSTKEKMVPVMSKNHIFDDLNYFPHNGQIPIHNSPARMKVVAAGRRFGKSMIGGNELVPEALSTYAIADALKERGQRREFWIVGPEYSDSEKEFRIAYNGLTRLEVPFDRPGTYNNPENGDMHMSLWGGAFQVHAKSAKYPDSLVGEGLSGVILAEAAKLKERIWTKYIRPTLADFKGWGLMPSTPEGKNWFYRMWQRGQDPNDLNWASWRRPSWVNDHVFPVGATDAGIAVMREALWGESSRDPDLARLLLQKISNKVDEEVVDMARDMSQEKFNQEIGADFTEFVGRVFKDFDEEVHVSDLQYNPEYPLYACCDYGWTNPFVWLFVQVDVWDNVNVLGEYRASQRDINDIAVDLELMPLTKKVKTFYPDPAAPGDTAVLEKKLHVPANGGTGGELKHRLEYIRQGLRVFPTHGLDEYKRPKLLIDRSCYGLIYEMGEYRWPDSKEESLKSEAEKPLDKDDHGPEALGRFYRGYYGAPGSTGGAARPKVRRANTHR
jgi:hypothetical protein